MLRSFSLFFLVASASMLTACGGAGSGANTSALMLTPQQHSALLQRKLLQPPPPGAQVFMEQAITVLDGKRLMSFPSSAVETRSANGLIVTFGGRAYHFSSAASIVKKGALYKVFVLPGKPIPEFLKGRQPTYITK